MAIRKTLIGAAVWALCAASWAQESSARVAFDIKPQPIGTALTDLGEQAGLQVLVRGDDLKGVGALSHAVSGELTVRAALERVLEGSGLRYEFLDERTVRVTGAAKSKETSSNREKKNDLRLAQAEGTAGEQQQAIPKEEGEKAEGVQLEEIVVTGTNIRGIRNPTSPTEVYTQEDIQRSGYGSTQQFMRSLVQNFRGGQEGASEDGVLVNGLNFEGASGVNLRGLGANSTLVLLNGRRVAPSSYGRFFDISLLPLGVIDRIEVLADGASAIYGADAVGGVVNFVTRKTYEGAETSARFATASHSDRHEWQLRHSFGAASERSQIVASLQYQDTDPLRSDDRAFTSALVPMDLYPSEQQYSAILSGGHKLTDTLDVFSDVLFSRKDVARDFPIDATSPLDALTRVEYSSFNAGAGWNGPSGWRFELVGQYGRSRSLLREIRTSELPGYVSGAPELRNLFEQREASLKGDGRLLSIPGGEMKLALGLNFRHESLSSLIVFQPTDRRFSRNVRSAFGELYVPLVGDANAKRFLRRLDLSAAARVDHYSEFGSTTNPKLGLLWAPIQQLSFHASYGKSFRAPNANEVIQIEGALGPLGSTAFIFPLFALPDGSVADALLFQQPVPIEPERAKTLSFGFDWSIRSIPGFSIRASIYSIRYRNRIIQIPLNADPLLRPDVYGDLLTQFAGPDEAAAFADNLTANGYQILDFTPNQTGLSKVRGAYRFGLANASRVKQDGADVSMRYQFEKGANQFRLSVGTTFIDGIDTSLCATCSLTDLVNDFGQPLKRRARATFGWTRSGIDIDGAANFSNRYNDTNVVPAGRMSSWTTLDLRVAYEPPSLAGLALEIGATNVLDRSPPQTEDVRFINGYPVSYDAGNADPVLRTLFFQARKSW